MKNDPSHPSLTIKDTFVEKESYTSACTICERFKQLQMYCISFSLWAKYLCQSM